MFETSWLAKRSWSRHCKCPHRDKVNNIHSPSSYRLWSSFCNQRGAKVLDSTDYNAYLAILNEKVSSTSLRCPRNL